MVPVGVESLPGVERLPRVLQEVVTAQTGVARMQITHKPFDNVRVRQAVQLCMDQRRLLELAHRGKGEPAEHHHVAPSQPDYARSPHRSKTTHTPGNFWHRRGIPMAWP